MTGHPDKTLRLIAIFKLVKGSILALMGFGAFHLLHKDVAEVLVHWVKEARVDPDNRFLAGLLAKAGLVDDHKLELLGGLTLVYAALFLTEGVGLLCQQRWAEYLTIFATGSLIPLEIYELCRHTTALKIALTLVNVAIVIYLVFRLREKQAAPGAAS